MKEDYILIAVDPQSKFAIRFMSLENTLAESLKLHKISGDLTSTYCEFIIGGVLLGSRSDEQEATLYKLDLTNSPLTINCEVSPLGPFRSALFPPEKKDQYQHPPQGHFSVTRLYKGKENYQSIVPIKHKDIKEMFKSFLTRSVQTDSLLLIYSETKEPSRHFGLWIEKLPDTSKKDWNNFIKRFKPKSFFEEAVQSTNDPDKIVQILFPEGISILAVTKPRLHCSCSKERLVVALQSLPVDDLVQMFMDGQGVETQCDYCHTIWSLTDEEMQELIKAGKTVH